MEARYFITIFMIKPKSMGPLLEEMIARGCKIIPVKKYKEHELLSAFCFDHNTKDINALMSDIIEVSGVAYNGITLYDKWSPNVHIYSPRVPIKKEPKPLRQLNKSLN